MKDHDEPIGWLTSMNAFGARPKRNDAAAPAIPEGAGEPTFDIDHAMNALKKYPRSGPGSAAARAVRSRIAFLEFENARLREELAEAKERLSGRTMFCENCEASARSLAAYREVVEAAKDIRCTVGTIVPNFLKPLDAALSRLSAYNWEHDFENPIAPGQG